MMEINTSFDTMMGRILGYLMDFEQRGEGQCIY
jgi:hypothetical protein